MDDERFPILGKGEIYTTAIPHIGGGGTKKPIRSYDEARSRLLPQFHTLLNEISICRNNNLMLRNKFFFQVALDHEYLAKSHFPSSMVRFSQWEMVGSRPWYQIKRDNQDFGNQKLARMLFFQSDPIGIENTYRRLEKGGIEKKEQEDFIKIDSIGLQRPKDRLIGLEGKQKRQLFMELIFHPMKGREWNECRIKLSSMLDRKNKSEFLWNWKRGEESEPSFLPAYLTQAEIARVSEFNPVRVARPMPAVSVPRIAKDRTKSLTGTSIRPMLRVVYPKIGIIDGGADTSLSHLNGWVSNIDMTSEGQDDFYLEHGTAVCGAALYGPIDPSEGLEEPSFKIKSFRVFPVPREAGFDLDLYKILDWLEEIVRDPANKDIRIYSLSFGPNVPIDDQEVDRFTVTLDRLAYEYDILFFVAAGNDGDLQFPSNRIQPPSDMVNGLGVGSFTYSERNTILPANYCCVGPGRPGSQIKPDISAFGGSAEYPFHVLLPRNELEVSESYGTSFSTPCVASLAGNLLHRATDPSIVTPQTSKALIIHHAEPFLGLDRTECGWGAIRVEPERLMLCARNEVKLLYNGILNLTQWHRLKLPFAEDLEYDGRMAFEWTFVYASDVRIETPDDYTLAGLEVTFRPHAHYYSYTKDKDRLKLDERTDEALELMSSGWKKSGYAVSKSYRREEQLRENGKWDTVLRGKASISRENVSGPVLDVHALGRGEWEYRGGPGRITYAAVVTVKTNDAQTRLYEKIRERMRELVPVELRVRARRRVT